MGHFRVKSANFDLKMKEFLAARCSFFRKSAAQDKQKMAENLGSKQNFEWFWGNFGPFVVKSGRAQLTSRPC
ncbi:MAG: hypothetical protein CFE25_01575 [Chitinophagaceae bacterium BSSC1]|nr:MAG: hypothetical protein CFE25_01575 [Chitinophagaceae bacterium BSSC1]